MSRIPAFSIVAAALVTAVLASSCGEDSPTGPPANPNAGKHEITVDVHHFKITGSCETDPTNPGEFHYALRVLTLGFADTLWVSEGNLTGLPGALVQPAKNKFVFIMDPKPNQGFEFEPRCTEYDNGVADRNMWEYGTYESHIYGGGTNWGNGLKVLRVGATGCSYEVQYSVSVRVL